MNKGKAAEPPQPQKRTDNGTQKRQRNNKGQFVAGNKGGGRPKLRAEFKAFAQEKSFEALKVVWEILLDSDTNQRDRLSASRILLEYGYGRPAAELDKDRLDLDRSRLELERKRVEAADKQEAAPIQIEWDGAEELAE